MKSRMLSGVHLIYFKVHVPDNVVLYRGFPKASSCDELYVLQEDEVYGCNNSCSTP